MALDACFSGAGGRSVLAERTRPLVSKVDQDFNAPGPVVVLTASAGEEITVKELYDYLLPWEQVLERYQAL